MWWLNPQPLLCQAQRALLNWPNINKHAVWWHLFWFATPKKCLVQKCLSQNIFLDKKSIQDYNFVLYSKLFWMGIELDQTKYFCNKNILLSNFFGHKMDLVILVTHFSFRPILLISIFWKKILLHQKNFDTKKFWTKKKSLGFNTVELT